MVRIVGVLSGGIPCREWVRVERGCREIVGLPRRTGPSVILDAETETGLVVGSSRRQVGHAEGTQAEGALVGRLGTLASEAVNHSPTDPVAQTQTLKRPFGQGCLPTRERRRGPSVVRRMTSRFPRRDLDRGGRRDPRGEGTHTRRMDCRSGPHCVSHAKTERPGTHSRGWSPLVSGRGSRRRRFRLYSGEGTSGWLPYT